MIKPMSMREKTQADFDLEKMFAYLDEALTSRDERVQSALRGLLTIIELTRPQDDGKMAVETKHGPLRQMQEDLKDLNRRMYNLAEEVRNQKQFPTGGQPYNPGSPNPPGAWWGLDPNMPHTTSKTSSSSSYTLTDNEKNSIMNTIKLTK